jgi:hypothetical protein
MRQSEREARLSELANKLFGPAREVLNLGTGTAVGEPTSSWTPARRYQAASWRASSDTRRVREGLTILRAALVPGAPVLLVAPRRAPVIEQLRCALRGEQAPRASLEPLCDALLLAGFCSPRVHDAVPDHVVLSAALAAQSDPLDAFFEQPTAASSR